MSEKIAEYDYEAPSYDETRFYDTLGQHFDYLHKRIVGSLLRSSDKPILDVGTGTGRFATWLAEHGHSVTGVDVSKEMLKKAGIKKHRMQADIDLVLADMRFLPFRRGTFENCICINVLDHISNIGEFFKEVKHVLRSDGVFIFNFSNLRSLYLPVATFVNLRKKALFRSVNIQSYWVTLGEVNASMSENDFAIRDLRGCFVASPLPFGEKLAKIIQIINLSLENSRLKLLSGSLFVKAQLAGHLISSH